MSPATLSSARVAATVLAGYYNANAGLYRFAATEPMVVPVGKVVRVLVTGADELEKRTREVFELLGFLSDAVVLLDKAGNIKITAKSGADVVVNGGSANVGRDAMILSVHQLVVSSLVHQLVEFLLMVPVARKVAEFDGFVGVGVELLPDLEGQAIGRLLGFWAAWCGFLGHRWAS